MHASDGALNGARDLPPPPIPIDYLTDPAVLEQYGLPLPPDPTKEPQLHEIWKTMLAPGREFVWARSEASDPTSENPAEQPASQMGAVGMVRLPTSLNWSGGYRYPNRGDRFSRVAGSWVAPAVSAGDPADKIEGLPYRCSIWVGIDGKRQWAGSMPQLGSEHSSDGSNRLWWQWWVPGSFRLQHYVTGITITPGDEIYCNLSVVNPSLVRVHYVNATTNKFASVEIEGERPMYGSSAQWVVERPAKPEFHKDEIEVGIFYPMPRFDPLSPTSFAARGTQFDDEDLVREYGLTGSRIIMNMTQREGPPRSAIVGRTRRPKPRRYPVVYFNHFPPPA